jgi:chemotaxis response regulator CheB
MPGHMSCEANAWDRVKAVWLLAGSAGATGAVQRFLAAFRTCPPVAFVYAQHYDPARQEQLRQLTASNLIFHMELIEGPSQLAPGRVLIVPPRNRIAFGDNGAVGLEAARWRGGHTPDFNELGSMLAAARLPASGLILFSGMGSDGCLSLELLSEAGSRIWAQDPATATCRGIPSAALATGLVQYSGTPEALALHLQQLYF